MRKWDVVLNKLEKFISLAFCEWYDLSYSVLNILFYDNFHVN